MNKEEELFEKAKKGDISILSDEYVAFYKNENGYTPLHILALLGKVEILNKSDIELTVKNKNGDTPLHLLASTNCNEALSHNLISHVKNIMGQTPLHLLAMRGNIGVVHHPDSTIVKDNNGNTPLHCIMESSENMVSVICHLSESKLESFNTVKNNKGETPKDIMDKERLFQKAKNGDTSILTDPNLDKYVNGVYDTPLHLLAVSKVVEVLNHPSVTTIKNNLGITPLHYLAMMKKIEVISHPDVATITDNYGNTPLHYIALEGVDEIINHPEAKNVKNKYGETPYDLLKLKKAKEK